LNVNIIKPMNVGPDTLNLTNIVHTTSSSTESSLGSTTTPAVTITGSTEGFLDVLKDIGKVALPILSTGLNIASPLLGPLGAPAAASKHSLPLLTLSIFHFCHVLGREQRSISFLEIEGVMKLQLYPGH
jgi:hypothetical protein